MVWKASSKQILLLFLLATTFLLVFLPVEVPQVQGAPDPNMPSDFLAYTGMEDGSVPPTYEEGWVDGFQVGAYGGDYYANVADKSWDVDVNGEPSGRSMRGVNPNPDDTYRLAITTARGYSGIWVNSETGQEGFYMSYWSYLNGHYSGTWVQWYELREFDSASGKWGYPRGSIGIFLMGSGSNLYWWIHKGHTAENPAWCSSFGVNIYSNSWAWTKHPSDVNPDITSADWIVNPHRVPWQTWFRLELYVRRGSQQDGILTVWITDPTNPDPSKRDTRVLFHIENADTSDTAQYPSLQNWEPAYAKQYGGYWDVYYDEIYFYNYNAHVDDGEPPPPPNPPNAGTPQTNSTNAGTVAQISSIASCDSSYLLSHYVVETNNTGTPTNTTGDFLPSLILTFDDNYDCLYTDALPLMDNYGYDGVAFIWINRTGSPSDAYELGQNLSDAGWEIGSHTVNHPFFDSGGGLSADELNMEIVSSKAWLEGNITGCGSVTAFAYPYGENSNTTVVNLVENTYQISRDAFNEDFGGTWDGTSPNYDLIPYTIRSYGDYYIEEIDEALDYANMTGENVILLFHDVQASPTTWGITPTAFDYVLDQINQTDFTVTAFKDALYRAGDEAFWNYSLTLDSTVGNMVYFKVWVNDTYGGWSEPTFLNITLTGTPPPSDPPWVGSLAYNTTNAGDPVNITGSATDDLGLSHRRIETNNTGTWVNSSWTEFSGNPTSASFDWQTTLNSTEGLWIIFRAYVNDTNNQWATNELGLNTTGVSPPPQPPNAGIPQLNTTVATYVANVSSVASSDSSLNLSHWSCEHNVTGTFQNVTGAFSGTASTELWDFTVALNNDAGKKVRFRAWVNDTNDVWSSPSTKYITLQATPQPSEPPYVNNLRANITTIAMPVNITGLALDDVGLSGYIIGTDNGTVTFQNQTWQSLSGTSDAFSWATVWNDTIGTIVTVKVWVNDTHSQWSSNEMRVNTTDYTSARILSFTQNTTVYERPVLYKAKISDTYGIHGVVFSTNNSQTWMNSSYQKIAGTPTSYTWNSTGLNSSFTVINYILLGRIDYKLYINNTKQKWAQSAGLFFVSGGYSLTWSLESKQSIPIDDRLTYVLTNASSGATISYTETFHTLWGETDYDLKIYFVGDLVYTETFSVNITDVSKTVTLDAITMPNLGGIIVLNSTTTTLTLQEQYLWSIKFTAEGSAGPYLIKLDVPQEPLAVYKDGETYSDWTYDSVNKVVTITATSLSEWEIEFGEEATTVESPSTVYFGVPYYQVYINFAWNRTFTTVYRENTIWYFDSVAVQIQGSNITIHFFDTTDRVSYTVQDAGTQKFYVPLPYAVVIDGVAQQHGHGWSYAGGWVTVTDAESDVTMYFESPAEEVQKALAELSSLTQYLLEGDFLGFIQACYLVAFQSLNVLWLTIILLFTAPLYIRTKSLTLLSILWVLLGGFIIVVFPVVSGVAILLWILAVGPLLWKLYSAWRG